MILWAIQVFSIAGKENTPLASLHYRYVALLNNPPNADRRCIDYMEPMLRQFYLDHLRMSHVYLRSDLPRLSQAKAIQSMKRLVESVKIFLGHSALSDADAAKASSLLDTVNFELFYPGTLNDPGFSPAHLALALAAPASAGGGQGLQSFRNMMGSFVIHSPELNKGWPIPAFSFEPMYIYGINTMFVPYPVFAWAYMDSKSKLPFSMPVYGLRVIRELFKVIDYRAQWWVGKDSASEVAYQKLEDCVKDIERNIQGLYCRHVDWPAHAVTVVINEPVERYEAIAEIAAVHVIFKMYTDEVDISKKTAVDVRLPFFQTVPSTTQFFIALAIGTGHPHAASTRITFGCTGSQRMRVSSRYMRCVFWNH
ncbi:hypothetical protein MRX96_021898 [Rhipicephalus microplus]